MASMRHLKIGDSRVLESRESADGITIRRRRESSDGQRFTTYERIEYPNLAVIKKTVAANYLIGKSWRIRRINQWVSF